MSSADDDVVAPSEPGRPRPDLAVEIVDDDVCIYDPVSTRCHVLSGGATLVWHELAANGHDGVEHRVAAKAGVDVAEIADDIAAVLAELHQLELLTDADGHDGRGRTHDGHRTTGEPRH